MRSKTPVLETAILGLLKEAPLHGYELRKRLNIMLGSFRVLSYGSLYPALKSLVARGLITGTEQSAAQSTSRPPSRASARIVYELTAEGKEHLQTVLASSGPAAWEDESFDVRFAFFAQTDAETRIRILEGRRTRLTERLEAVRESAARTRERLDEYTLELQRHGLEQVEREVRWLDGLITTERDRSSGHARGAARARSSSTPASCGTIRAGARRREASRGPWNNEHQGARMTSIRVAIVGVGNCASSLVQGVHFYRDADPSSTVPGLMHVQFGDYHVSSLEFVAAFDVDAKKVGFDLSEAINASENNTIKIADVPPLGVTVQRGPTLDGVGKYYAQTIEESDAEPVDVVAALREAQVDVLVCYLPVGSEQAAKFYAQAAIDAGVAFVNALPVFIASDPEWAAKFEEAGVPIVGDDIKSQVGATITHRVLAKLFEDRGVVLDRTYQLNVGGNMDFKNMLERERLESRRSPRRRP